MSQTGFSNIYFGYEYADKGEFGIPFTWLTGLITRLIKSSTASSMDETFKYLIALIHPCNVVLQK